MNISRIESCRILPRSGGVGLVTAIFVVVVMAGLAVAMVSIFGAQQSSSALDVQGARAYQAARAGIEWGLFQNLRNGQCLATHSFALPATSTLNGFTVTVACTTPATAAGVVRHGLTATACNQPTAAGRCPNPSNSADYVERQLEAAI